jgi:hypothetical protein
VEQDPCHVVGLSNAAKWPVSRSAMSRAPGTASMLA